MIPESLGSMAAHIVVDTGGIDVGAKQAMAKLEGFAKNLRSKGLANIAVGVSIGLPLGKAIHDAAAFGTEMAMVSTMLEDTAKWMPTFSSGITRMSVQFGEGTDVLAKGLYDILSASIPAENAMGLLEVAVRGARAGLTDTAVSVDALTSVLNAYALDASKAADISDWFFSIVKRGKTTFPELASDIGMVATTASVAGLSLDEMGAAIATMTRVGVKTNMAVTALNNIISTFLSPTQEAAEYAAKLGFSLSSTTIKAEGLRGVFERISGLPPDAIARLFPNIRALRGVLPALQNLAGFDADLKAMGDRAGAAGEAFTKMNRGIGPALKRMGAVIRAVSTEIGSALAPALEWIGEKAAGAAGPVLSLVKHMKWAVVAAAAVGVALIGIGSAMLAISFAPMIIGALTTAVTSLGAVLGVVFSPIGLLVGALLGVGAAVVSVIGVGDTFGAKLQNIAQRIWSGLLPAFRAIRDTMSAVWAYLRPIWEGMKSTASAAFTAIGEIAVSAWATIRGVFESGAGFVGAVWTGMWGWIGPYAKAALDWTKNTILGALDLITFSFKNWRLVSEFAVVSWAHSVVAGFNTVIHQITQLPIYLGWAIDNWQGILKSMVDAFSSFTVNIGYNLKNFGQAIWDVLSGKGWTFEWTDLLQGYEHSLKQLPAIAEREIGGLEKDLQKRLGEVTTELGEAWATRAAEKAVADAVLPAREAVAAAERVAEEAKAAAGAAESPKEAGGMGGKLALARLAERGSAEAYTAVTSQDRAANTTAKNTGDTVKELKNIAKLLPNVGQSIPTIDLGLD